MHKYLAIIVALLVFFAFAAQSIIGVKLIQLQARIQRDRILNLELSSQALQARSRRLAASRRDFRSEIRQSVIESGLLNSEQPEALHLSAGQYAGLGAINLARLLALKPVLHLFADYESLLLLRYAFYLERNRRYAAAIERYQALATRPPGALPDEMRAFVQLHLAYCLASVGSTDRAIVELQAVQRVYGGTHFSRAASILLHVLQDGRRRSTALAASKLSDLDRARSLVQLGQCAEALAAYERHRARLNQNAAIAVPLKPMDGYHEALCFEETGQIRRAIAGYQNVVRATRDRRAAVLANRRLLIVGNFYAGDAGALTRAAADARRLGDAAALGEISSVAREQQAPLILEELRRHALDTARDSDSNSDPELSDSTAETLTDLHAEVLSEIGPVLPPLAVKSAAPADRNSRTDANATAGANSDSSEGDAATALSRSRAALRADDLLLAERMSVVTGGATVLRNLQGQRIRARRLEFQAGGLRLIGAESDTGSGQPGSAELEDIQEIRPAPLSSGQAGVLEIGLADGRVVYARALTRSGGDAAGFRWVEARDASGRALTRMPALSALRWIRTP